MSVLNNSSLHGGFRPVSLIESVNTVINDENDAGTGLGRESQTSFAVALNNQNHQMMRDYLNYSQTGGESGLDDSRFTLRDLPTAQAQLNHSNYAKNVMFSSGVVRQGHYHQQSIVEAEAASLNQYGRLQKATERYTELLKRKTHPQFQQHHSLSTNDLPRVSNVSNNASAFSEIERARSEHSRNLTSSPFLNQSDTIEVPHGQNHPGFPPPASNPQNPQLDSSFPSTIGGKYHRLHLDVSSVGSGKSVNINPRQQEQLNRMRNEFLQRTAFPSGAPLLDGHVPEGSESAQYQNLPTVATGAQAQPRTGFGYFGPAAANKTGSELEQRAQKSNSIERPQLFGEYRERNHRGRGKKHTSTTESNPQVGSNDMYPRPPQDDRLYHTRPPIPKSATTNVPSREKGKAKEARRSENPGNHTVQENSPHPIMPDYDQLLSRLQRLREDVVSRRQESELGNPAEESRRTAMETEVENEQNTSHQHMHIPGYYQDPNNLPYPVPEKRDHSEGNSPVRPRSKFSRRSHSVSIPPIDANPPPFLAGKSTGASFSVGVNLQQLLSTLKSRNPLLYQAYLKMGPSATHMDIGQLFHFELSRHIHKLEASIDEKIKKYDSYAERLKREDLTWDSKRELEDKRESVGRSVEDDYSSLRRCWEQYEQLDRALEKVGHRRGGGRKGRWGAHRECGGWASGLPPPNPHKSHIFRPTVASMQRTASSPSGLSRSKSIQKDLAVKISGTENLRNIRSLRAALSP